MLKYIPKKICAIICMLVVANCVCVFPIKTAVSVGLPVLIEINGQAVDYASNDQGPMIIQDRTYVPIRVISENLGAKVEWKPDTRQVLINRLSQPSVTFPASSSGDVQIIIDGQLLTIPNDYGNAFISKLGRTMIPLRAVGEALGCEVNWENGTVYIKANTPAPTAPVITPPPVSEPVKESPLQTPNQPGAAVVNPTVNLADSQLLKDLAQYRSNLKLMNGTVINSGELATKDPAAFSPEQLVVFRTYLKDLSKYQPSLTLPTGEQINTADINILGTSYLTVDQLKKWMDSETPRLVTKAQTNGQEFKAIPDLAELYIRIGAEYGIRGDLAFCQAAKETGYWQFTGSVQPWQNNYCGLWATGSPLTGQESPNGADPSQVRFEAGTHGAIFVTPAAGVEAHIQHLYAYATKNPLPAGKILVDPRFVLVNKGIAPSWQQLNARWAVPGTTYGQSIISDYWFKAVNTR